MKKSIYSFILGCVFFLASCFSGSKHSGSFQDVSKLLYEKNYLSPSFAVAGGDINSDGYIDVIISHHTTFPQLTLHLNDKGKRYKKPINLGVEEYRDLHGITIFDINQDGLQDVLVVKGADRGKGQGRNEIYINDGTKLYQNFECEIIADPLGRGRTSTPFDLNNDGVLDIILSNVRQEGRLSKVLISNPLFPDFLDNSKMLSSITSTSISFANLNYDSSITYLLTKDGSTKLFEWNPQNKNFIPYNKRSDFVKNQQVINTLPFDFDNDGDFDLIQIMSNLSINREGLHIKNKKLAILSQVARKNKLEYTFKIEEATVNSLLHFDFKPIKSNVWFGIDNKNPQTLSFDVSVNNLKKYICNTKKELSRGCHICYDTTNEQFRIYYTSTIKNEYKPFRCQIQIKGKGVFSSDHKNQVRDKNNSGLSSVLLFENKSGMFMDVTHQMGLVNENSPGDVGIIDINNDGYLDLFILNSTPVDDYFFSNSPNIIYLNMNGKSFKMDESTNSLFAQNNYNKGRGNNCLILDYDNDGNMDILTINGIGPDPGNAGPINLFKNINNNSNNYLSILLKGSKGNLDAWGTRLKVITDKGQQYFQKYPGNGSVSTSNLPMHIGLGNCQIVDTLKIKWDDNSETILHNIKANQKIEIIK